MPTSIHIDPARRLVTSTFYGRLTDQDLADHMVGLLRHPDFHGDLDQLVDARGISQLDITSQVIRESTQQDVFTSASRRAIVVAGDAVYGMARMFQSLTSIDPDHLLVTRDMDEAIRWLESA